MALTRLWIRILVFVSMLTACGSDSGSNAVVEAAPSPAPTGSNAEPALDVDVVEAFPALRFNSALFLTYAPDDTNRLFVVQQTGQIFVFENREDTASKALFLDISGLISSPGGEEGLLGLAFHPEFRTNGLFFVNYTAPNPLRTVIARYRVSSNNPNSVDPASRTEILSVPQPFANHNGGMMVFGPDQNLYIGLGDGGGSGDPFGNGQSLGTLLGKILRIRVGPGVTYEVPADNPFIGVPEARPEIWALGLRNPWRFSFDRMNGRLWLADVGQSAFEEVDIITRGGNFGWDACEGRHVFEGQDDCPNTSMAPVLEYGRDLGGSVTGGYVYRGAAVAALRGFYIYGDFISRRIWALSYDGQTLLSNTQIATLPLSLSSFGEDQSGELYLVGYSTSANPESRIFKFKQQ